MKVIKKRFIKILFLIMLIILTKNHTIQAQNCSGLWSDNSHPIAPPSSCFIGQLIGANNGNPFPGCPVNPAYTPTQTNTFTFTNPVSKFSIDFSAFTITSMISGCPRMELKIDNIFYPLTLANVSDLMIALGCPGSLSLIAITPDGYITGNGTAGNVKGTININGINATSVTISTNDLAGTVFSIPHNCTSVVPIKLSSFTGLQSDACNAILNWETETESHVKTIEVLRSSDGIEFNKIADVFPKGSYSHYNIEVKNYTNGYFRLKTVDFDGHYEYSEIVKIRSNCINTMYSLHPNPSHNYIEITGLKNNDEIVISDVLGRSILSFYVRQNNNRFNIQKLPAGLYYLRIINDQITECSFKIVKH